MNALDFVLAVLRTWGHILVGIGVVFAVLIGGFMIAAWYRGIIEQIDEMRRNGKLPPMKGV